MKILNNVKTNNQQERYQFASTMRQSKSISWMQVFSLILCYHHFVPSAYSWSSPHQSHRISQIHPFTKFGKSTLSPSTHIKALQYLSPVKLFQMNQNNNNQDGNQDDEDLWGNSDEIFNDFEGFSIGEEPSSTPQSEVLSNLVQNLREKEVEQSQKRVRNWNRGNWEVRGFSLDPFQAPGTGTGTSQSRRNDSENSSNFLFSDQETMDESKNDPTNPRIITTKNFGNVESTEDDESPIYVCKLAVEEIDDPENDEQLVAVGRSDGSVFVMRIGSEYVTSFKAVPKVSFEPTDDVDGEDASKMSVVKIKSKLVRNYGMNDNDDNTFDEEVNDTGSASGDPFELIGQFHHNDGTSSSNNIWNAPISAMLFMNNCIYTAIEGLGEVKEWSFSEGNNDGSLSLRILDESVVHSASVTSITGIRDDQNNARYLLSTSLDGSFIIRDLSSNTILQRVFIPTHENIANAPPASILCADVEYVDDKIILYFGLSTGQIVAYELGEVLSTNTAESAPRESCRFFVDPNSKSGSVTAIKCAGFGTETASSKSTVLITGGENGAIKQWEMISRKGSSALNGNGQKDVFTIEYWPRLSSQRLQKIAHVFKTPHFGKVQSIQVLALQETDYYEEGEDDDYGNTYANDARKLILTAAADGSIYVSSSESGEVCYRMDGFTNELSSVCLCNHQNALITDGMGHHVCLHDFDIDEDVGGNYKLEF